MPTWSQDTLGYIGPQLSLNGRGPKLCICRCTRFLIVQGASFRELLGLNHREEVVLGLGTSSGCHHDGDSEILNGPVEGRWYHIKVSQYGIIP